MNIDKRIREAVQIFWGTRKQQELKQKKAGKSDAGSRSAVTGGKQMTGFERLAADIAIAAGIKESSLFLSSHLELPGYYRPEKKWDLLIVDNGTLVAALEFKSQVGPSFGNNFNNRTEEAIGTATDLWTAYREGALGKKTRPWLGYLFLLEDHSNSTCPVKMREPHFKAFPEFQNSSYAKRYEILLTKMILERCYDSAALILSENSTKTSFIEPQSNLAVKKFFVEFEGCVRTYLKNRA